MSIYNSEKSNSLHRGSAMLKIIICTGVFKHTRHYGKFGKSKSLQLLKPLADIKMQIFRENYLKPSGD